MFSCKLILEDEDAEEEEGFKDSMKIPSKKGLGSGSGSGSGASEFTTSAVTPSENTSSEDAVGGDCDEGGDEEEEEGFKDSCKGISDLEISSSSSKVKFADMSNNRQGDKDGNGENNDEEDEEEEGFKDSCKAPVDPSKTTAAWKVLSDDSGDGDLDCHHQQQQQQRDDKDSPEDDNSSSDRDSEEGFKDSCKDPTSSSLSLSADNNKNTSNIQSDLTHGSKDGCGGGNKDGDDKEEEEDEEGFKDSCKARSEEAASTSTTDSD